MNKSLEILKTIYKPYRYTIKGKVNIIETSSGNYVIKKSTADIGKLYNYLQTRNFYNFPSLIDESRANVNVFEYLEEIYEPIEQKYDDLLTLVASLHNKTSYYKEVSEDNYKTIYENINSNLNYLKNYYQIFYDTAFKEIYSSPANYMFLRNYAKINGALEFCQNELEEWYSLVKEEKKIRVVLLHNNLSVNHFIKADKDYLISWDNYKFDTPVLDIVNLYKKEYLNINFEEYLNKYGKLFPLLPHEKKLLFILIVLPPVLKIDQDEFKKCENMRNFLDYIYKTENLIRPYYANEEKEQ